MRLVAVLGYSDRRTDALHPICAARLARAASEVRAEDVVLFSGWARRKSVESEADLMVRAWMLPAREIVVDRGACSTVGNAIAVARATRVLGVDEVVLVTSSWHGRRASALLRAALLGSGAKVSLVATDERARPTTRLRELTCWALVPLLAVAAARTR